ncbi:uncharacterized protein [Typha angustifolia]|uniref:uncharacterized protein n=1 Tax=Typha angustifolia TaxID=59011 RepID=UPI003C2D8CBD
MEEMIEEDPIEDLERQQVDEINHIEEDNLLEVQAELSLHSLAGNTHNFVDLWMVRRLGLESEPSNGFDVIIGDGTMLRTEGICRKVQLHIQGHTFQIDFYPLALRGVDIVLGVQWLRNLGPVTLNFTIMAMEFRYEGNSIQLKAASNKELFGVLQSLEGLSKPGRRGFLMQLIEGTQNMEDSTPLPVDLKAILQEFKDVFQQPHGLPPPRAQDHRIEILPRAGLANVRPYQYPFIQNEAISKMV